ncbi:fungal-specific transcription factor domain-containing protein [Xylaria cf. heliscus]|nr:fungal-specific transcription factor domain-containing protein [Xylaria cf. heliscus]
MSNISIEPHLMSLPTCSADIAGSATLESELPEVTRLPPPRRRKRSQVTRACDWCRVHRIKCDDYRPCSNCQTSGAQCSNNPSREINSLPHAFREIERLKQRIRELERDVEDKRMHGRYPSAVLQTAHTVASSPYSYVTPDAAVAAPSTINNFSGGMVGNHQQGILICTTTPHRKAWYGQSSLHYFTNRLRDFIALALQQHITDHFIQPHSASLVFASPTGPIRDTSIHHEGSGGSDMSKKRECLTATQEEYFLSLFWQSYHTSLMILNEAEFKQHYRSLWAESKEKRKPSALVDIVIAVCIQYGKARDQGRGFASPAWHSEDVDVDDASIAGCWHYHQCQTLLACELECPSLSTLQCTILAVIWLYNASFQNTACSTLALAVNMAHVLGLHIPSTHGMVRREAEMRKRLWWAIYVLDAKINMGLGRPFLVHQFDMGFSLPDDDHDVAALSGSSFSPLDCEATWLSWNTHVIKLAVAARSIYAAFNSKYVDLSADENLGTREASATFLAEQMKYLDSWVKAIPMTLKIGRKGDGYPFSTDCSPLDMEQFAPSWVQHQRLTLELLYHNLSVTLWRPYVLYKLTPASTMRKHSPTMVELCAKNCANHALALTHIMRQVLTTTDILAGWYEAFQWQWNCAITLVGFAFTCAAQPLSRQVQNAIVMAIEVFDIFGRSFAAGASAANVMRKLKGLIDNTASHFERRREENTEPFSRVHMMMPQTEEEEKLVAGCELIGAGSLELDSEAIAAMQEILSGSLDLDSTLDYSWV